MPFPFGSIGRWACCAGLLAPPFFSAGGDELGFPEYSGVVWISHQLDLDLPFQHIASPHMVTTGGEDAPWVARKTGIPRQWVLEKLEGVGRINAAAGGLLLVDDTRLIRHGTDGWRDVHRLAEPSDLFLPLPLSPSVIVLDNRILRHSPSDDSWTEEPPPAAWRPIDFADGPNNFLAVVGYGGEIHRHHDGQWYRLFSPTTEDLVAAAVIGNPHPRLVVVTAGGRVFSQGFSGFDDDRTWRDHGPGPPVPVRELTASRTAVALSGDGAYYTSADLAHWTRRFPDDGVGITSMIQASRIYPLAVGGPGLIRELPIDMPYVLTYALRQPVGSKSALVQGHRAGPFTVQWHKDGEPIAGAVDPVLEFDPLTPADNGIYHAWLTTDYGMTRGETVEIRVPLDFATWQANRFTLEERENPALSGPWADPAGTGLTHFHRHAFALKDEGMWWPAPGPVIFPNPTMGNPGQWSGGIAFRRARVADVIYRLEFTTDLQTWSPALSPNWIIHSQGETEWVTGVETTRFETVGPRFYRLRALFK